MQINHFFKQSTYHLGDQLEGMIEIANGEQEQVLSQVSIMLILRCQRQTEEQIYTLKQKNFSELVLRPHQHKRLAISYQLEKDLLVTSEQAIYSIQTEVQTKDGHQQIKKDQIPILPPKLISKLFVAMQQIGWEKDAITFTDNIQIFRFVSKNARQLLRACEFAIVFGDQGIKLLITLHSKNEKMKREAYLFYRWFDDPQQLKTILQQIFNRNQLKSTRDEHNYQEWMKSATLLGSRFVKFEDLGTDDVVESPPLTDLKDLSYDIFDDDPDED